MMPPRLTELFTNGEAACLCAIAMEVKRRGRCDLYVDKIAAFAGVSRSTAKNAIREAKRLKLIEVQEWRQAPDWNGPNRIRIVDQAWLAWLAHGQKEMTVRNLTTTTNQVDSIAPKTRGERPQRSYRKGAGGSSVPRAAPG
jgi:hypothetical protein